MVSIQQTDSICIRKQIEIISRMDRSYIANEQKLYQKTTETLSRMDRVPAAGAHHQPMACEQVGNREQ